MRGVRSSSVARPAPANKVKNRFDRMEWAGAFGDLGTLIPFVIAYISQLGIDPEGLLLAFGAAIIATGLYYRTPFPVQPMKALGIVAVTQAAHGVTITPAAVYAAGLVTGLFWLLGGLTGAVRRVTRLVSRPVVVGIVLGLGLSFMLDGARMLASGWLVGGIALLGTLLLMSNRVVPVMFLLLVFGAVAAITRDPGVMHELAVVRPGFRWPVWHLGGLRWKDLAIGAVFLALPQLPLTFGNAVMAVTEENNQLFPDRTVSTKKVAVSTGIMNLLAPLLGGVPMCHGAGGMAGHVRFGARTGGSLVILGTILVLIGLFFGGSVTTLLRVFPLPVLGVMLFIAGAQLALGNANLGNTRGERFVALTVATLAIWNIAIAFLFGVVVDHLLRRKWMRP